jgi:hypothetical protein
MTRKKPSRVIVGKQIIEIITSGMYSDPLMVLREYVQNSVDAIDIAADQGLVSAHDGRIDVELDGRSRTLSISDNGTGVSISAAEEVLCSLGNSTKQTGSNRGFRGIGRLGGVGYCDRLVFETRQVGERNVAVVSWECQKLRKILRGATHQQSVANAVRQVAELHIRPEEAEDPPHFFRATMHNVHQFHKDELMSIPTIGDYLSRVGPVGFDPDGFPHASKVESHLAGLDGYRAYAVFLNGKKVFRPHKQGFHVSGKQCDQISDVELFYIPGPDGSIIGKGWYACTNYRASLPPSVGMRGIRLRQGNIEVGNEYALADSFSERRFATWHIGEVHLNYALKANARRDGFEQSPECEAFLEQANRLGRHLSNLCRVSSKERSARASLDRRLRQVEELLGQHRVLVDEDHFAQVQELASQVIGELEEATTPKPLPHQECFVERLAEVKKLYGRFIERPPYLKASLDGRAIKHLDRKSLLAEVARQIVAEHHPDKTPEQLVTDVMSRYLRPKASRNPMA